MTSREFTSRLKQPEVRISMEGQGRVYDNIVVERLGRTETSAEGYVTDDVAEAEAIEGIGDSCQFYHNARPHQALRHLTPAEVHVSRGREPAWTGPHCCLDIGGHYRDLGKISPVL